MVNELTNDEIEELVGLNEVDKNMLRVRKNGLMLTDNQVETLERYNIDVGACSSLIELLYMIDDASDDEELDYIAQEISERNYYENTHK